METITTQNDENDDMRQQNEKREFTRLHTHQQGIVVVVVMVITETLLKSRQNTCQNNSMTTATPRHHDDFIDVALLLIQYKA